MTGGVSSTLGYKAVNELGLGISVSGTIFNKKGNTVASIQSSDLGMGSISFIPELGQKYTAEINLGNGKTDKFDLPEVQASGYYLHLLQNNQEGINPRDQTDLPRFFQLIKPAVQQSHQPHRPHSPAAAPP